jgi:hypothetical protein
MSMRRFLGMIAVALLYASPGAGADQAYFQQFVRYTIRARLDAKEHRLTGSETIVYANNSPDTLREFYLHLYPNAFSSKNSPLMKDARRQFNFTFMDVPEEYRSHLSIRNVKIDGKDAYPKVNYTIAQMDLPVPLPPGDTIRVSLEFDEKIPRHASRMGYKGKQYDLAQWYPKVVVYDRKGFHPDPFQTGEFYGEFGVFDVYLEVPEPFVVVATGEVKSGDPGWRLNPVGGKRQETKKAEDAPYKTVHFHAENVHDFAWNASPSFAVQDTTWNGVAIRSVFDASNKKWQDTTLVHELRAMEWLTQHFGPYPYPHATVVQSHLRGGMEYPMLVMDGSVDEDLVVHEIGHIYFYGALGNDERAEAWLDEGFTTFQTAWYLLDTYGEYGITRDWNWYQRLTPQFSVLGDARRSIFSLARLGYGERVGTRAELFKHDYWDHVYRKAALVLFALRYVVGNDNFDRIMKQYVEEWKFKHVTRTNFQHICERVSGMDLEWFFDEWIYSRKTCDYRLSKVESRPSPAGDGYDVNITIDRLGETVMPVEIVFMFRDGTVETTRLDGRLRTITHAFTFPEKPKATALNPNNEIIDIDLSNNFLPRRRDLQIDWPNNHYYPEHAYQIRHRPAVWYNDIDGLKVGYHLRGSFFDFYRRLQLGVYYGLKSHRVDFSASYAKPTQTLGLNSTMRLSGYKMEGREDATWSYSLRKRDELIRPPTQQLTLSANIHELTNPAFVIDSTFYQTGADFAPLQLNYQADPQFDILRTKTELGLRFGRKWFGTEYKYTRFFLESAIETRESLVSFDAGFRVFLGVVSGGMPNQRKFNLAGAGVLDQESLFFLRSPGAIWPEVHYLMPGDGNLRGYAAGTFPVNKLLAANAKLGRAIPLLSRAPHRWLGEIKLSAFADVGTVFDDDNPISGDARVQALTDNGILKETLFDAGLGLHMHRRFPFWDFYLRFDVPFYVNQPQLNGEAQETDYRYLFSLTSVFALGIN